ncbi:hypothetical protein FWF48_00225 [Candidatus Saccharibacteria bacterium]|nr:hypothetical protein [Candidatus Saccharibacteria bacterium]
MRFEETPGLFGSGVGSATNGDFTCGVCHTRYNEGNDESRDYFGDSVPNAFFAGLEICGDCFERVEDEVLRRMSDILPWYGRIVEKRLAMALQQQAAIDSLPDEPPVDKEGNGHVG